MMQGMKIKYEIINGELIIKDGDVYGDVYRVVYDAAKSKMHRVHGISLRNVVNVIRDECRINHEGDVSINKIMSLSREDMWSPTMKEALDALQEHLKPIVAEFEDEKEKYALEQEEKEAQKKDIQRKKEVVELAEKLIQSSAIESSYQFYCKTMQHDNVKFIGGYAGYVFKISEDFINLKEKYQQ